MSSHDFFRDEARRKVATAVAAVEQASSAEVVVTVRRAAGRYGQVDLALGACAAFGALVVYLLSDTEYPLRRIPLYVLAVFAFTVFVSASFAAPRRLFASPRAFASNVASAARAAFFDQGLARTRGRTGILVFVGVLEGSSSGGSGGSGGGGIGDFLADLLFNLILSLLLYLFEQLPWPVQVGLIAFIVVVALFARYHRSRSEEWASGLDAPVEPPPPAPGNAPPAPPPPPAR